MPLASPENPRDALAPVTPIPERPATSARRWYQHRLVGLLLAILCFEMGIFLVAFPWSRYWDLNYFSWLSPGWRELWIDPYFRGAVSGFGVADLYLSLLEVLHLQGLALRRPPG